MNSKDLSDKMSEEGAKLILDAFRLIENKKVNFVQQKELEVTYAKKIEKKESKINWNENATKVIAKINALNPFPGCWFELAGKRVKIIKAKEVINKGKPGIVLDKKLTIACLKNAVRILELQKEGKKKMSADEFLLGSQIKTGQSLN